MLLWWLGLYHSDGATMSDCECPLAGFCPRHKIDKPPAWHRLCQTKPEYRDVWDQGIGPGQRRKRAASKPAKKPCGQAKTMPPLSTQAWNLTRSLVAFVSDGGKLVNSATYHQRLAICHGCDERVGNRCSACGCNLTAKAKARAWECPLGYWGRNPLSPIPVFMTAAPRDQDTQWQSIQSVYAAGFSSLTILAEPGTELPSSPATVLEHAEQRGQWRNLIAALRAGVASGAPQFITMEDDVILHPQLGTFLASEKWPDERCGCVQLYAAEKLRKRYHRGGRSKLRPQDALDLLGCCALLFGSEAATTLVDWADRHGWRGDTCGIIEAPSEKKAGDTFVGEVLVQQGYDIWIHNPSLADHIGHESTMGHHNKETPNRRPLDFPGVSSDLFSIFTTASSMKIVALYKTFDGGEFIDASLASVYDNVDAIVMVHSDVSWLGERGNTVRKAAIDWCQTHDEAGKVHHVDVSLDRQEAQYEAGLNYIAQHKIPHDVILAVDADEIWEDQYFERARQQMADHHVLAYRANMHTYLKSPFFRVTPPFGSPTVFLRDARQLLKSPRGCQAPAYQLDNVWMHHYTYVRESRDAVERKLRQSCRADGNETVVKDWMTLVYDRLPIGESLHGFVRWRDVWKKVEKIWWSEVPPAMRQAKLLPLWLPEGHLMQGERDALYRLAKGRQQAVDLGTYKGLSAAILSLACDRVHTVDCYDGSGYADTLNPDRYRDELTGHSLENTLQLCERLGNVTAEQSHTANAGQRWGGGPVDVLFVDADHSEQGTMGNVSAWLPHMKVGGLIVMHDNNDIHPGVQWAVQNLERDYRLRRIGCGDYSGSLAAFEVVK